MTKNTAKKLKIAFVIDDGLDRPDGVQQYVLTLGEWLKQKGHTVHYLAGETSRTDRKDIYSLAKNINVSFNGNKLSIPLPTSRKKIKEHLQREQYDVLHVQIPHSPFFGARVVSLTPTQTVVVGTYHILPYGIMARIGTRLLGLVMQTNMKRFDEVLSVSRPAQAFAKESFGVDSTVIPNMVTAKMYKQKKAHKKTSPLRILFVGRLVRRKGCAELLRALGHVLLDPKVPDFRLDICGSGPMQVELERLVDTEGLANHVTFHGFVSEKTKIEYMQKADLSIFPSISGESFGIVLIEAMSAGGGVVLGGNNPGYSSVLETVPEALSEPRNMYDFAAQIKTFLIDKKQYNSVRREQHRLVKQFDVDVVGKQVLDVYKTCQIARTDNNSK